jgi:hypothetical protein
MQMRFYTQRMKIVNKATQLLFSSHDSRQMEMETKKVIYHSARPRRVFKQFKFTT